MIAAAVMKFHRHIITKAFKKKKKWIGNKKLRELKLE